MTPEQRASLDLFEDANYRPGSDGPFLLGDNCGTILYSELVKRYRSEGGATRRGDWMQTATGRQFWPLDPLASEVYIEDIATALSKLCRYGGHCRKFYSVAEHCVLMANAAPPSFALAALMHDASEAYLSDVIRPIKRHLPQYGEIEAALERVIAARFSLPWPMPAEVKALDERIIVDERDQAMAKPPVPWREHGAPLGVTLQFWSPDEAERQFLDAFRHYGERT